MTGDVLDKSQLISEVSYKKSSICAANNADWYSAMFRSHDIEQQRNPHMWMSRSKALSFHSNLVTLAKEPSDLVMASIFDLQSNLRKPWALKDSFANLELKSLGFEILFDASWIWRDATSQAPAAADGWTKIQSAEELRNWELAWRHGQTAGAETQFRASLLQEPSVSIFGMCVEGVFTAGCIANASPTVTGLSNFFSIAPNTAANYAAAAAIAQSIAPAQPLISFERGPLLACAESLGFESVGQLRIWHNP